MLIAYIDEFGHQGSYISHSHPKHNTHPVFGYAGYIIPADRVRVMGGFFQYMKEKLLREEIKSRNVNPQMWEKKGSQLISSRNYRKYGHEIIPVFNRIYGKLGNLDGNLFFFGQQKPIGNKVVTNQSSQDLEDFCLIETMKRLDSFAASKQEGIVYRRYTLLYGLMTRVRKRNVSLHYLPKLLLFGSGKVGESNGKIRDINVKKYCIMGSW